MKMFISGQFFYFAFILLYFLIWIVLFLRRKDLRTEMVLIGLVFGAGGILSELTHTIDWWQPPTITGTRVSVEDFLIGFFIGGVVSVVYEELYRKRLSRTKTRRARAVWFLRWSFLGFFATAFLGSFYLLGVHSFYASLVALVPFSAYILVRRRDLILDSFVSGILTLVIGTSVYFTLYAFYPDFVRRFWYLPDVWFGKLLFGIPVAEYLWYFFVGAFIGPLYEYLQQGKLENMRRK